MGIHTEKSAGAAGGITAATCREESAGQSALMWPDQGEGVHQLQCLHGLPRVLQDLITAARPQDPSAPTQDDPHVHGWSLLM